MIKRFILQVLRKRCSSYRTPSTLFLLTSTRKYSFKNTSKVTGPSPLGDPRSQKTRHYSMNSTCTLRPYQKSIVDAIGWSSNAIVKMPTGSGKTIVAAELVKQQLERDNDSSSFSAAALFLVPAQDLVEQQASVIRNWCPVETTTVFEFMGGMTDPRKDEVTTGKKVCIVSTPKAFSMLQRRKPHWFGWDQFGIVVFDEVHHVLKDHPYRDLALDLRDWHGQEGTAATKRRKIQVIGMSASLTYDITESAVRATLGRLCRELMIDTMISPSIEELEGGGYNPQYGTNVELERCSELPEGVVDRDARKPHLLHSTFLQRIETKTATPFCLEVWRVVGGLEQEVKHVCPKYMSPLNKSKLISWEDHAYKHQMQAGATSSSIAVFRLLSVWYTALRLLVQSWEEDEVLVMQWLQLNDALTTTAQHGCAAVDVRAIQEACKAPYSFYKLGRLRYHLIQKREKFGDSFRCIVFVQTRIAAYILSRFINADDQLQRHRIGSGFVTANDGMITPDIKMTKQMKAETVASFRAGSLNVIVATSVLEEGFDVPAANVMISYDHMKDSVELCQRSGRARQRDSSIVILDERPDRPLTALRTARDVQDDIVAQYDPTTARRPADQGAERSGQLSRERTAFGFIFVDKKSKLDASPVQWLNLYTKKTKASLSEHHAERQRHSGFICSLTYRSLLRSIQVEGHGITKKAAKNQAAVVLLAALKQATASAP